MLSVKEQIVIVLKLNVIEPFVLGKDYLIGTSLNMTGYRTLIHMQSFAV